MFIGLILVLATLVALIAGALIVQRGVTPTLRPIEAYQALNSRVGEAIEAGGRVHVSLGSSGLIGDDAGTTLASLAILDLTTDAAAISDLSPVASTSDATTLPVINDTIARVYRRKKLSERYERNAARLAALDSMALAGAGTAIAADDRIRANVLVGSFGPEVALMAEAGSRHDIGQIIGSDRIEAEAVSYAMSQQPLIGEEIFVARAYMTQRPAAVAAVVVQDLLRWLLAGAILLGAVMATLGLVN